VTIWRPVVGWEGLYEASDDGRIRKLAHSVKCSNGATLTFTRREITPRKMPHTNVRKVRLETSGRAIQNSGWARVILTAFVGPRGNGNKIVVRHIDGDYENFNLENLEWITRSELLSLQLQRDVCRYGHDMTGDGVYTWTSKNKPRRCCKKCYYDRQAANGKKRCEWLRLIKEKLSCVDCGMSFSGRHECLDFHHRNPEEKEFLISRMWSGSKDRVLKEIAKCDPICANCHRTRHAGWARGEKNHMRATMQLRNPL